eukprot:SAG25_NODE_8719_length_407_cov_1.506494_1_plen_135_part_11
MPSSSPPLLLPPPCASSSRGAAAQLECTAAYEAEKAQLARLPPARRRVALRRKRGEWLEQRRQEQQNDTEKHSRTMPDRFLLFCCVFCDCMAPPFISATRESLSVCKPGQATLRLHQDPKHSRSMRCLLVTKRVG